MKDVKDQEKRRVEESPDDAVLKLRQAIEAGLRDSDAGRTVSVEEVRARFGLPR
jgi:predicted transcriptional regulator